MFPLFADHISQELKRPTIKKGAWSESFNNPNLVFLHIHQEQSDVYWFKISVNWKYLSTNFFWYIRYFQIPAGFGKWYFRYKAADKYQKILRYFDGKCKLNILDTQKIPEESKKIMVIPKTKNFAKIHEIMNYGW